MVLHHPCLAELSNNTWDKVSHCGIHGAFCVCGEVKVFESQRLQEDSLRSQN